MKVVFGNPSQRRIGEFPPGEVFKQGSNIFMKMERIENDDGEAFNAVCLYTGEVTYFEEFTEVTCPKCSLVIE